MSQPRGQPRIISARTSEQVQGNITSDVRTITGAGAKTVAYAYSAADLVTQITYPSGRIVTYARDTTGRIVGVTTKLNAGAAAVNVATAITYQPISNLIKPLTYGNALTETAAHTLDYEQSQCTVANGATPVSGFTILRGDSLNITGITDTVTGGNSQTLGHSAANRLNSATGAYGSKTWIFDGVGNRTSETNAAVTDSYTYPATNNKLQSIVRNAATVRSFTYDNAGNMATDVRSGTTFAYGYNNANRLKTVTSQGNLLATYTYNGLEQLISRVITNSGTANGTTHFVHDLWGNVIAELNASGQTIREYIWQPEAEIAPTRASRAQVARPMAVISGVNTATPQLLYVYVDHLNRPNQMRNASGAVVWEATYESWGAAHSITGAETLDYRFPGQWFQLEAGLHYNWHRHYDPTLGRYTQPDPLGFVDGPGVYGYARNNALRSVDKDGRLLELIPEIVILTRVVYQCYRFARWFSSPPPDNNEPPDDDKKCTPPEGTQCYNIDLHKKPNSRLKFTHYHIMEHRRIPATNSCQWQELRDKIGVGVFPVLDLRGMLPCSAYGASRS